MFLKVSPVLMVDLGIKCHSIVQTTSPGYK